MVQIGISADTSRDWGGWVAIDAFVAGMFAIELFMKISIHNVCGHFCGDAPGRSILDVLIVIMAFLVLYLHIQGEIQNQDASGRTRKCRLQTSGMH